jgi:hypothetical protein
MTTHHTNHTQTTRIPVLYSTDCGSAITATSLVRLRCCSTQTITTAHTISAHSAPTATPTVTPMLKAGDFAGAMTAVINDWFVVFATKELTDVVFAVCVAGVLVVILITFATDTVDITDVLTVVICVVICELICIDDVITALVVVAVVAHLLLLPPTHMHVIAAQLADLAISRQLSLTSHKDSDALIKGSVPVRKFENKRRPCKRVSIEMELGIVPDRSSCVDKPLRYERLGERGSKKVLV